MTDTHELGPHDICCTACGHMRYTALFSNDSFICQERKSSSAWCDAPAIMLGIACCWNVLKLHTILFPCVWGSLIHCHLVLNVRRMSSCISTVEYISSSVYEESLYEFSLIISAYKSQIYCICVFAAVVLVSFSTGHFSFTRGGLVEA
jgi:hypothetical protein